jgi:hypothetical protein
MINGPGNIGAYFHVRLDEAGSSPGLGKTRAVPYAPASTSFMTASSGGTSHALHQSR